MKKKTLSFAAREQLTGYAFLSPWIIGFLAITLYPVIYSIAMSFCAVKITGEGIDLTFRGFYYYDQALNVDPGFSIDLGNTLFFILCFTPVIVVLSLISAVLLNNKFRGRGLFRAIYFLPVIIMSGPVISTLLSKYTVSFADAIPQIYAFLNALPDTIKSPAVYILDNIILIMWFSGVQILIFLAGLQKINPNLYEAASMDGAGTWEKFWKITLPHTYTLIIICTVYTIVELANYVNNAVNKRITVRIFDDAGRIYSLSSAMSWIVFVIVMVILGIVWLMFYLLSRRSEK
ncbi:MAG: sugar ABC transporter permease [Ruminococcaceae bacterium]|nr:sugar ABC transporter permease [Oscillospiraceae bacterium]